MHVSDWRDIDESETGDDLSHVRHSRVLWDHDDRSIRVRSDRGAFRCGEQFRDVDEHKAVGLSRCVEDPPYGV